MFVIRRNEDGAYVSKSGNYSSYTRDLRHARKFESKEAAERNCCGNERVVGLERELDAFRS